MRITSAEPAELAQAPVRLILREKSDFAEIARWAEKGAQAVIFSEKSDFAEIARLAEKSGRLSKIKPFFAD